MAAEMGSTLDGIDDIPRPVEITVRGKQVTLWHWSEPWAFDELEMGVHEAIDSKDGSEGWTLQVRNALTGQTYCSAKLPAWADIDDEFEVAPGISITVPYEWAGTWTRSPESTAAVPAVFSLTIGEGWENDVPPRTSQIQVESYETSTGARAASDALSEQMVVDGWSADPMVAFAHQRLRIEARRFVRTGTAGDGSPSIVTEVLVSAGGDSVARIIRSDHDAADAARATTDLKSLVVGLLKLLDVRAGAAAKRQP